MQAMKTVSYTHLDVYKRQVSYKYRSFILGYKKSDLSLVFLEVSPDLTQVGEELLYRPQDVKKTNFTKMVGSYYLQYGNSFKKEFFNFFVPKTIDDIVNHDWYDEETFTYICLLYTSNVVVVAIKVFLMSMN